jgi:hypothetical protein
MGLLSKLALLPLAPVYGVVALARELEHQADEQLFGEAAIRRDLDLLQEAYEAGELGDDEFASGELDLLRRLEVRRRSVERPAEVDPW